MFDRVRCPTFAGGAGGRAETYLSFSTNLSFLEYQGFLSVFNFGTFLHVTKISETIYYVVFSRC